MLPKLRIALIGVAATLALGAGCSSTTLFAPVGTVIALLPSATAITANGQTNITVTLTEMGQQSSGTGTTLGGSSSTTTRIGTPVHDGTIVEFVTTLGRIEPAKAFTTDGVVIITLFGGGQTGKATITAFSGGITKTLDITVNPEGQQ